MELLVFVVVAVAVGGIGVAIGMLVAPRITSLAEREDGEDAADGGNGNGTGAAATDERQDEPLREDEPQRDDRA